MEVGCVSPERRARFEASRAARERIEALLAFAFSGGEMNSAGAAVRDDGVRRSLADWLRFPEVDRNALVRLVPEFAQCGAPELEQAVQDHRYAPYLARQEREVERLKADESVLLPPLLDYESIAGLSNEMVSRLSRARPTTLGAASRIRGITPAALAALLVHARRRAA
jgi:tRNA uridine 5-carboxymethylaminomethyl modification enzyme